MLNLIPYILAITLTRFSIIVIADFWGYAQQNYIGLGTFRCDGLGCHSLFYKTTDGEALTENTKSLTQWKNTRAYGWGLSPWKQQNLCAPWNYRVSGPSGISSYPRGLISLFPFSTGMHLRITEMIILIEPRTILNNHNSELNGTVFAKVQRSSTMSTWNITVADNIPTKIQFLNIPRKTLILSISLLFISLKTWKDGSILNANSC